MWILLLALVAGFKYIITYLTHLVLKSNLFHILEHDFKKKIIPQIIVLIVFLFVLFTNIFFSQLHWEWAIFYSISFGLLVFFVINNIDINRYVNIVLIVLTIFVGGFISAKNIVAIKHKIEGSKYIKAELRSVGEWYAKHAMDGEKMVVSEPWVVRYYTDTTDTKVVMNLSDFKASSYQSLISELREKNVQYVVWDSSHGNISPSSPHYYYFKKYKMDLISVLKDGQDSEHFKLIKKLAHGRYHYAYIYEFVF